jgi:hypothetical protein
MGRKHENDNCLISLLEQSEIIAEGLTLSLPSALTDTGEKCPQSELIAKYQKKSLSEQNAFLAASHMIQCNRCRDAFKEKSIMNALEQSEGRISLHEVRRLMNDRPHMARAMARIGKHLREAVSKESPAFEHGTQVMDIMNEKGEFSGGRVELNLKSRPFIDSDYNLKLELKNIPDSDAGFALTACFKREALTVELGPMIRSFSGSEYSLDLSDLQIGPGYFQPEVLEIGAVELPCPAFASENDATALLATDAIRGHPLAQTMTSNQLREMMKTGTAEVSGRQSTPKEKQ